jgi:hypothetical protein
VRYEARDVEFSLSDSQGIAMGNAIYRRLCALVPWNELNKEDTSLSTTAGTNKYTWPSTYNYIDVTSVEIQDPYDNSKYKRINAVRSEMEWNIFREMANGFPEVYKRSHDGTNDVILFAPTPNIGSLTIRITGQTEPTEYTDSSAQTVFLTNSADDAYAYLIAADIADKRAQPNRANALIGRASEVLSVLAGKEITPDELRTRVLGNA